MFTFIELQGFSKRRQLLLPDDEFRAFQELLIQDPTAGDIIAGTGSFRKIPGTVLEWGNGVHSDNLLQRNTQWPNLSGVDLS